MKAKHIRVIICFVIFLCAHQTWAADWIYYDTSAVGDKLYYDKSSIKKENKTIISVWTKNILSKETKTKYFSILKKMHEAPDNPSLLSYCTRLMQIDCVNKKMKGTSVTFYDKKDHIVHSELKNDSGKWDAILPNTVGEKLINIVSCETLTPKEAGVVPKIEETVTPKEAVLVPNVEETVTPKKAVAAPKVEASVTPKETVAVAYSGHVASFKSEDNAVISVERMKAKGLVAFYQKEHVPGKGEFYRLYIGRYKTLPLAREALTKLKKAGEIDSFQIQKVAEENGEKVKKEMSLGAQKNEPAQKQENKTAPSTDTKHYYEGIKGIVLKNGKVVKGQIISVDDDVLKIRTKKGEILSYSFINEVTEYITE